MDGNQGKDGLNSLEYNDFEEPKPTDPEVREKWFRHTLSENMSTMYAVFLFMLGIVVYMADTFSGKKISIAEGFNCYLIIVQMLWLFSVHIDVRSYVRLIVRTMNEARTQQEKTKSDQVQLEPTGDGQYQLRINMPEPRKTIPQHYGFTSGRHGGSLYLKIGATVFCFGHLIHSGLNLGQKILYLTLNDAAYCTGFADILMSVLVPIYSFYQLFFIFKYSNLIINRRKILSRFGLMHCIASSLCFWFYTILQETLQAIVSKKTHGHHPANASAAGYSTYISNNYKDDEDDDSLEQDETSTMAEHKLESTAWSINYGCEKTTDLTSMINYTTPYLYPFSIEFNILIVGLWILLWENIGRVDRHTHIPSVEVIYEEDNTKGFSSNFIIYVDCHSSNRGLFVGLLVTVATVISIIMFFIFSSSAMNKDLGSMVNSYSEIFLLAGMAITALAAFVAIRKLDINLHPISSVDDILLYMCLPCIFLYAFLSLVPALSQDGGSLEVIVSVMQVSQVVIQTALICDGLRRCSNSSITQNKKPGREVITFLIVANVAMWLLETFEIKSVDGNKNNYEFYGKELWTLLSHLALPLALFYRFHSSVCLADMWKSSYEAEELH